MQTQRDNNIFTRVEALSVETARHGAYAHLFDPFRLDRMVKHGFPTGLLANLLLDAASECVTCQKQINQLITGKAVR